MRTKRTRLVASVALALGCYVTWPLLAAWDLRQAVKTGDTARLTPRVDWGALRQNLRLQAASRIQDTTKSQSWWRRAATRAIAAPVVSDRAIDLVVTPERLGWLLRRRLDWREFRGDVREVWRSRSGTGDEDDDPLTLNPSRLRWAFFESPTRFRIEVLDKTDPTRRIGARLALNGLTWQLVDVFVLERA